MAEIIKQFNTAKVSRISGFSVRRLDYWATTGMLVPSVSQSSGPGTRKLYNFDDLIRLQFIKQLHDEGWSTQKIRAAITHLDAFMEESPKYRNHKLIPYAGTILILCETKENQHLLLDALNPSGQQMLWIVLDMLRDEIRKNANELINLDRDSNSKNEIPPRKKASS